MQGEFRLDWELSTGRARNPGRACNGPERHKSIPVTSVPGRGKEDAPRCVTAGMAAAQFWLWGDQQLLLFFTW